MSQRLDWLDLAFLNRGCGKDSVLGDAATIGTDLFNNCVYVDRGGKH